MAKLKADKKSCHFSGKHNHMQRGKLVENPRFMFQLEVDGKKSSDVRGDLDVSEDHFDYMAHSIKGVTLAKQTEYYKKHKVKVIVTHFNKQCKVVKSVFKATPKGWVVTKEGLKHKGR